MLRSEGFRSGLMPRQSLEKLSRSSIAAQPSVGKLSAWKASEPIDLEQLLAKSNLATKIALTTHRSVGESPLHWSNQDRST